MFTPDDGRDLTCLVDLADSCALHFVSSCVHLEASLCQGEVRTLHIVFVLLHVSQFHPQSTIITVKDES